MIPQAALTSHIEGKRRDKCICSFMCTGTLSVMNMAVRQTLDLAASQHRLNEQTNQLLKKLQIKYNNITPESEWGVTAQE